MKFFAKTLIILFVSVFSFACLKSGATDIHQTFQNPARIILEIDALSYDSLGSPNGRSLDFRLFENGEFEYEELSTEKLKDIGFQSFSSEVMVQKQGKFEDGELNKFLELISSKDFQKINWYYKNAKGFCTCGATRLEIRHRNDENVIKNIIIDGSGCTDLTNPSQEMFPDFPKSLSNVLKQVRETKYPDSKESAS
jgi:hypothetical protein